MRFKEIYQTFLILISKYILEGASYFTVSFFQLYLEVVGTDINWISGFHMFCYVFETVFVCISNSVLYGFSTLCIANKLMKYKYRVSGQKPSILVSIGGLWSGVMKVRELCAVGPADKSSATPPLPTTLTRTFADNF